MELTVSMSLLLSVGGIIASVASAFAIVKTKVARIEVQFDDVENELRSTREEFHRMHADTGVKVAILENNQQMQKKELEEMKADIKTIMGNVQDIKEVLVTVSKVKKGGE